MEIWKDIKDYEGLYKVSNYGRVLSLPRKTRGGQGEFMTRKKIIKGSVETHGYRVVVLYKNNVSKRRYVHRLVGEAFIPNPKNKPQINHINSTRDDNHYNNLEWVTAKENMHHGIGMGSFNRTEKWIKNLKKSLKKHQKKVKRICLETGDVKIYESVNSVKTDGFNAGGVSECCNGLRSHHHGYHWEFV